MEIALGFHSLTTTTHPSNVNLPYSEQQFTARLSAPKVSITVGNGAQDALVRDTTLTLLQCPLSPVWLFICRSFFYVKSVKLVALCNMCLYHRTCNFCQFL
jgi:hypothetical protein